LVVEKQVADPGPDLEAFQLLQTVIKGMPTEPKEKIEPATCDTKKMVNVDKKYFSK
jgi:hypothetical protein